MKKGFKYEVKYPRTFTQKMKIHLDAVRPQKGHPCYAISAGRPTKENLVKEYKKCNPDETKYRCAKDLGLSYQTVCKWWDS